MSDFKSGIPYYKKSIPIFRNNLKEKKDTTHLATAFENLGLNYFYLNMPDSAMIYFKESGELFRSVHDSIGLAYNQLNKGLIYAQKKDFANAEININKAFPVIENKGDEV